MEFTKKKILLYLLAMVLLASTVATIQSTMMGMSSWDALSRNFYEGIPIKYKWLNPILALLLVSIAYLIEKKKPNLIMLFPILISFFIGAIIDFELLIIPDVSNGPLFINIFYLLIATVFVGIALNIIVYSGFPLPALDQLCLGIAHRFKLTFGQGKYIGEAIALVGSIIAGEAFGFRNQFYFLGFTTFYFLLVLGFIIDSIRFPLYRIIGAVSKIDVYTDDLVKEDINKKNYFKYARALIIKDHKIMLFHHLSGDYYSLPFAKKRKFISLERILKLGIFKKTGLKIKNLVEKVIIKEYFLEATYESHYYRVDLKFFKQSTNNSIISSKENLKEVAIVWIDLDEVYNLLDEHDAVHPHGIQIMNREFLGIINSI